MKQAYRDLSCRDFLWAPTMSSYPVEQVFSLWACKDHGIYFGFEHVGIRASLQVDQGLKAGIVCIFGAPGLGRIVLDCTLAVVLRVLGATF